MSLPRETPLAKNWTLAVVAGATVVVVAASATGALIATEAVPSGVIVTVGVLPPLAVTLTVAEVVVAPRLSVAMAVRAKGPATVGVHARV